MRDPLVSFVRLSITAGIIPQISTPCHQEPATHQEKFALKCMEGLVFVDPTLFQFTYGITIAVNNLSFLELGQNYSYSFSCPVNGTKQFQWPCQRNSFSGPVNGTKITIGNCFRSASPISPDLARRQRCITKA
jgi:hypothetical protein